MPMLKTLLRFFKRDEDHPATPYVMEAPSPAVTQAYTQARHSHAMASTSACTSSNRNHTGTTPFPDDNKTRFWEEDAYYVQIQSIPRTVKICGFKVDLSPTIKVQLVSKGHWCPNGNTDPLHWLHGPEDEACSRTNDFTTWAVTREHIAHIISNGRRGEADLTKCDFGCTYVKIINKEGAYMTDIIDSMAADSTSDVAGPSSTPANSNPYGPYPVHPAPADGTQRCASLPFSGSHPLYINGVLADDSHETIQRPASPDPDLTAAQAEKAAHRSSIHRFIDAIPSLPARKEKKVRSRRPTVSSPSALKPLNSTPSHGEGSSRHRSH